MTRSRPFAVSADGTAIHAVDYGSGKPIVIVHGGMQAAENWDAVGARLEPHWRIVAIERRVYGRSGTPKLPHSMAREAEDIRAVLAEVGEPAIMLGHSSGGLATLEAALTHPPTLRGIILYEPPVQLEAPLGAEAQARAEAAQARGDASEAMKIFFTDILQLPSRIVGYMSSSPEFSGGWGEMQRLAPNQLEDNRAIRALPLGVERYLAIDVPALLLRGSESPKHLHKRLDALARVIPMTEAAEMVGENHTANITAPERVAPIIEAFAKKRLG